MQYIQKPAFFSRKNTGKNDKNITKIDKKWGIQTGEDNSCNLKGNVLGYFYRVMETWEKREVSEVTCRHGSIEDASSRFSFFLAEDC